MSIAEIKFRKFGGPFGPALNTIQRTLNELIRAFNTSTNTHRVVLGPWVESDLIGNSTLPMKYSAEASAGEWPDEVAVIETGSLVGVAVGLNPAHATLDIKFQVVRKLGGSETEVIWTGVLPAGETHKTWRIPAKNIALRQDDLIFINYVTPSTWTDNVNHMYVYLITQT